MIASKRILVTGGAGFLGSGLCEKLLSQGHEVICFDNLFTGREDNIRNLRQNPHFSFVSGDVISPVKLDGPLDEIYNFACPASPPHYQKDPIYSLKTSVIGMINMLDLAAEKNAKILQASTSEVYGDPQIHPQTEAYRGNVSTTGIRACYDEGKRCAETLVYDYHRMKSLNVRVVRIFNTYGPNMDPNDGRVVSNFIVQALKGDDITLYGDGTQTRSFCYRDDLLEGIVRLMNAPDHVNFPVNIGNPNEFTVRELADIVIDLTKSRSKIVHQPLPEDDPLLRCPDISKAREHLNWEPKVQLREGILKTIAYFEGALAGAQRDTGSGL
jgi:UDP-glucuronate decarboxylase